MASLTEQLLGAGFPTGEERARLVAMALEEQDLTDVRACSMIAHAVLCMFIGMELTRDLVRVSQQWPAPGGDPGALAKAMAFLTSYVFLLRLPSECLPIRVASGDAADHACQAVVHVGDDYISLRLKRRKNKEGGSLLTRRCWCSTCKETCPVHVLGKFFTDCGAGATPFASFDAREALGTLRTWLQVLNIEGAAKYRTHDFRRGHALDLQKGGASLRTILEAGEWRSAAFLKYLDVGALEAGAVSEAHENRARQAPTRACPVALDATLNESSDEDVDR